MYCRNCGQKMQEGEKFCANCGYGENVKNAGNGKLQAKKPVYNAVIAVACIIVLALVSFMTGILLSSGILRGKEEATAPTEVSTVKAQEVEERESAAPVIVIEVEKEETKPEKTTYSKYKNSRYGYSVSYPTFLKVRSVAENEDGIVCASEDGEVVMNVYGTHYFENKSDYYEYQKANAYFDVTYSVFKDTWFVLSGYDEDYIVYEKHFLNSDNTENTFSLRYPADRKEEFDPIVNYMVKNFKAGN